MDQNMPAVVAASELPPSQEGHEAVSREGDLHASDEQEERTTPRGRSRWPGV